MRVHSLFKLNPFEEETSDGENRTALGQFS